MNIPSLSLLYARWSQYKEHRPEWWAIFLSAGAWLFFIATSLYDIVFNSGGVILTRAGHAAPNPELGLHSFLNSNFLEASFSWVFHWSLMIAAMMFPLLIGQLRVVALRSFWFRRDRSVALFLCGYTALWLLYGLVTEASLQLQRTILPAASTFLVPLCFLMAACWQLTERKRLSLVACHLTIPLGPSGWRADFDCFRYGFRIATSCFLSCGALMFANVVAHHALWAMLAVTFVSWSERFLRSPGQVWFFLALLAVASVYSLIYTSLTY